MDNQVLSLDNREHRIDVLSKEFHNSISVK